MGERAVLIWECHDSEQCCVGPYSTVTVDDDDVQEEVAFTPGNNAVIKESKFYSIPIVLIVTCTV